ncbi:MAG: zinc ribbon domain-containing protein [Candidatus Dormibacteraeota bacterium]|nr:zinc ribbon domain-containing protein [Candidatus Dormibacteraeota bacterium]MBV9524923.1 zinc ribbon domain-containing protein [Candidatus Dormibacteraeota bacterium]
MIADTASILLAGIVAVVIYLIVLWAALAYYVWRDARRRSASQIFVALATLLGLFPFLGPLVYLVLRPPRTLEEQRAQALEEQALMEPSLDGQLVRPCPSCGREIEQEFIVCPYCRTQFARRCAGCDRSLRLGWSVCPYCAAEVGAHSLSRAGH